MPAHPDHALQHQHLRAPRLGPVRALGRRPRRGLHRLQCAQRRPWARWPRDVRAASLLAFLLTPMVAFLALVPAGSVAHALYDVIRAISAVFPFRPCPARPSTGAERFGPRPAPDPGPTSAVPGCRLPRARPRGARARDDRPRACAWRSSPAIRPTQPHGRGRSSCACGWPAASTRGPWDPVRDESFYTEAGQRLELDLDQRAWAAGNAYAFAVLDTSDDDRLIGRVALSTSCAARVERHGLDRRALRASSATRRAVRLALRFAFERQAAPGATGDHRNVRSVRVAKEKVGFRLEAAPWPLPEDQQRLGGPRRLALPGRTGSVCGTESPYGAVPSANPPAAPAPAGVRATWCARRASTPRLRPPAVRRGTGHVARADRGDAGQAIGSPSRLPSRRPARRRARHPGGAAVRHPGRQGRRGLGRVGRRGRRPARHARSRTPTPTCS